MARKKSGWNSLTSAQQSSFKKNNFDMNIKVSQNTISGLNAGKTFENNITKFKKIGTNTEQREALNRFYGKSRVSKALGSSGSTPKAPKAPSGNWYGKGPKPNMPGANPSPGPKATFGPQAPKAKSKGGGFSAGDFVKNELLGVDDFSRARKAIGKGNYGKAAKSAATGAFELGTTAAAVIGSFFSFGASGAGLVGAKTAQIAGRQAAKQIAAGATRKAITAGGKKVVVKSGAKEITAAPVRKAITSTPHGMPSLEKGYQAARAASTKSRSALDAAVRNQKRGLLTSGEVKAAAKTHELNRIDVLIKTNKLRKMRGLKPLPVTVKPPLYRATTKVGKAPAGSGKTRTSALPKVLQEKVPGFSKSPKGAVKAPTPKARATAAKKSATAQRKALAPSERRIEASSGPLRDLSPGAAKTRARLTQRLEKMGDKARQDLRTRGAGGKNTELRNWEKRVNNQGGGPKSGASVTAVSKAAAKKKVDVAVGKSKEMQAAVRKARAADKKLTTPVKRAAKKAPAKKAVAKKTVAKKAVAKKTTSARKK